MAYGEEWIITREKGRTEMKAGRQPTTRGSNPPGFPGEPGLSQFDRDLWRDVVVALASRDRDISSSEAADFASRIVWLYRTFELEFTREIAEEDDE